MKIRYGFVSNSSSEAFLCQASFSLEETKTILQKMLNLHNEIFKENEKDKFEDVFQEPKFVTMEDLILLDDFSGKGGHPSDDEIGKLIIYSEKDNTIPFTLFEIIEYKFEVERWHLG